MGTVGRLKEGDLYLAGEVNERLPTIKKGLVAHFPFDQTVRGEGFFNLLDYSTWTLGTTGSGNNWSMHGDNRVVIHNTPHGHEDTVLSVAVSDATSGYEGGWTNYNHPIDSTKKYRLSMWVRRENVGTGRTYFGCQGSTVCNLSNGTLNTNPYFWSGLISNMPEIENNWTLWVAYIHPSSYTGGSDPTNGMYLTDGTLLRGFADFKWEPGETVGGHRSYLYYSTSAGERQYWYHPRMEVCDGSEPTIDDLLEMNDNVINPSTNQGTTSTANGVAIEEATKNHLTDGLSGYSALNVSHWNGDGEFAEVGLSSLNTPIFRYKATGSTYRYTHNYVLQDDLGALSEKTVTFSLYLRRLEGNANGQIRIYDNVTGYSYQTVAATKDFQKFTITKTIGLNPTRMFVMIDATGGGTYEFHSPQLEEKPFATSFVNGSRTGAGLFRIDNLGGYTDYTVCGTFCPDSPLDGTYNLTKSSGSMLRIEDVVNTGGFYYRYYVSGTTSAPYMDNDGSYGGTHNHAYFNVTENKDLFYVITKSGTTIRMKLYQDGVMLGEHVNTTANATARLDAIVFGGTTIWNGAHKNVSVYKRALTEDEIRKLVGNSFSIEKNGTVHATIKENPVNGNLSTANYFPLGLDGTDKNNTVVPSTETAIAYENGVAWVGNSVTNLFTGTASNLGGGASTVIEDGWEKVAVTTSQHGRRYTVDLAKLTNGATYTSSVMVHNPSDTPISIQLDWCDAGAIFHTIQPLETKRINLTASRATYDSTFRFFDVVLSGTGTYWVKQTQVEPGTFPTPYVGADGATRGNAKLSYAPGINFDGSWTFGVFIKPSLAAIRSKSRNPFFELGSYYTLGETSIAVTSWSTTNNNLNIILTDNQTWPAAPGAHTLTDKDFDHWIFAVLRFNGTTLYYDSFSLSGHRSTSVAKSWTSPIRDNVSVAGYGWVDACNGYAKDFFYRSDFMSDLDIQEIYKTQMRSHKNNELQIQGQIKEGKVL